MITTRLKTEHVAVETLYQDDLPLCSMDVERMEEALLHILHNALDAVKDREEKRLSIRTALLTMGRNDRWIQMSISDTGPGIGDGDLLRIFDPFFTTKGPGKGTGLGLSIAYGVIQDHGGRIWAENREQGGATIFIELPA